MELQQFRQLAIDTNDDSYDVIGCLFWSLYPSFEEVNLTEIVKNLESVNEVHLFCKILSWGMTSGKIQLHHSELLMKCILHLPLQEKIFYVVLSDFENLFGPMIQQQSTLWQLTLVQELLDGANYLTLNHCLRLVDTTMDLTLVFENGNAVSVCFPILIERFPNQLPNIDEFLYQLWISNEKSLEFAVKIFSAVLCTTGDQRRLISKFALSKDFWDHLRVYLVDTPTQRQAMFLLKSIVALQNLNDRRWSAIANILDVLSTTDTLHLVAATWPEIERVARIVGDDAFSIVHSEALPLMIESAYYIGMRVASVPVRKFVVRTFFEDVETTLLDTTKYLPVSPYFVMEILLPALALKDFFRIVVDCGDRFSSSSLFNIESHLPKFIQSWMLQFDHESDRDAYHNVLKQYLHAVFQLLVFIPSYEAVLMDTFASVVCQDFVFDMATIQMLSEFLTSKLHNPTTDVLRRFVYIRKGWIKILFDHMDPSLLSNVSFVLQFLHAIAASEAEIDTVFTRVSKSPEAIAVYKARLITSITNPDDMNAFYPMHLAILWQTIKPDLKLDVWNLSDASSSCTVIARLSQVIFCCSYRTQIHLVQELVAQLHVSLLELLDLYANKFTSKHMITLATLLFSPSNPSSTLSTIDALDPVECAMCTLLVLQATDVRVKNNKHTNSILEKLYTESDADLIRYQLVRMCLMTSCSVEIIHENLFETTQLVVSQQYTPAFCRWIQPISYWNTLQLALQHALLKVDRQLCDQILRESVESAFDICDTKLFVTVLKCIGWAVNNADASHCNLEQLNKVTQVAYSTLCEQDKQDWSLVLLFVETFFTKAALEDVQVIESVLRPLWNLIASHSRHGSMALARHCVNRLFASKPDMAIPWMHEILRLGLVFADISTANAYEFADVNMCCEGPGCDTLEGSGALVHPAIYEKIYVLHFLEKCTGSQHALFALNLLDEIIALDVKIANKHFAGTVETFEKVSMWHFAVTTAACRNLSAEQVDHVMEQFSGITFVELELSPPPPTIRCFIQLFIVHLALTDSDAVLRRLLSALGEYDKRTELGTDFILSILGLILAQATHHGLHVSHAHLRAIVSIAMPLASAKLAGTRYLVFAVLSIADALLTESLGDLAYERLLFYVTENQKMHIARQQYIQAIMAYDVYTFINIGETLRLHFPNPFGEFSVQSLEMELDRLRASVFEQFAAMNAIYTVGNTTDLSTVRDQAEAEAKKLLRGETDFDFNAQQKIDPWSVLPQDARDMFRKSDEYLARKHQPLIVVTSYMKDIPSIAAIVRTCEIFGVEEVVVSDMTVVQSKEFSAVTVAADNWIPFKACSEDALVEYLSDLKQCGYCISAMGQSGSVLANHIWSTKVVLLLGDSIPVHIRNLCDNIVFIPSVGFTTTMNTHISSALAIWEYTRQHAPWKL